MIWTFSHQDEIKRSATQRSFFDFIFNVAIASCRSVMGGCHRHRRQDAIATNGKMPSLPTAGCHRYQRQDAIATEDRMGIELL